MESLQLAQMLADISDLSATVCLCILSWKPCVSLDGLRFLSRLLTKNRFAGTESRQCSGQRQQDAAHESAQTSGSPEPESLPDGARGPPTLVIVGITEPLRQTRSQDPDASPHVTNEFEWTHAARHLLPRHTARVDQR